MAYPSSYTPSGYILTNHTKNATMQLRLGINPPTDSLKPSYSHD